MIFGSKSSHNSTNIENLELIKKLKITIQNRGGRGQKEKGKDGEKKEDFPPP